MALEKLIWCHILSGTYNWTYFFRVRLLPEPLNTSSDAWTEWRYVYVVYHIPDSHFTVTLWCAEVISVNIAIKDTHEHIIDEILEHSVNEITMVKLFEKMKVKNMGCIFRNTCGRKIHVIAQLRLSAEYNFALRNIYFWIPNFKS